MADARLLRVDTSIKGTPSAMAKPLAVESPIRKPVYEPGPEEYAIASRVSLLKLGLSNIREI